LGAFSDLDRRTPCRGVCRCLRPFSEGQHRIAVDGLLQTCDLAHGLIIILCTHLIICDFANLCNQFPKLRLGGGVRHLCDRQTRPQSFRLGVPRPNRRKFQNPSRRWRSPPEKGIFAANLATLTSSF
jgi:hypothetical protein